MASAGNIRLAKELQCYTLHKDEWLRRHRDQYVVVRDSTVLDFFPTFEAAYQAGAGAWGLSTDFLVKQIIEHEPVFFVF
ncbi:MAG TPA: hypothetical protein VMT67_10630 [Terriglobales bacterium]|nr:hypothetical protein [Terriglobales bacterium]